MEYSAILANTRFDYEGGFDEFLEDKEIFNRETLRDGVTFLYQGKKIFRLKFNLGFDDNDSTEHYKLTFNVKNIATIDSAEKKKVLKHLYRWAFPPMPNFGIPEDMERKKAIVIRKRCEIEWHKRKSENHAWQYTTKDAEGLKPLVARILFYLI